MPLWALYKGRFSEEYVYSIMDSLVKEAEMAVRGKESRFCHYWS